MPKLRPVRERRPQPYDCKECTPSWTCMKCWSAMRAHKAAVTARNEANIRGKAVKVVEIKPLPKAQLVRRINGVHRVYFWVRTTISTAWAKVRPVKTI